jgi:hypothetical protein
VKKTKQPSLPVPLARQAERRAKEAEAQNRVEAQELIHRILQGATSLSTASYDVGEALGRLREKRLYRAVGYTTFDALLDDRINISRAQAYRFIAVAQRLTRSRATELGQRRSMALLRLVDATPGLDSVEDALRDGVTLPGRKEPVRVETMRVDELERAARTIARAHRARKEKVSSAAHRAAETFATRLRERLTDEGAGAAKVEVHRRARADSPEELLLRVEIPFSQRNALLAAWKGS